MIGVRLPVKTMKMIGRVAEALSCDRSSAIRWMINEALERGRTSALLRSGKGRSFADQIARTAMLGFKAKAAEGAVFRADPADRVKAEIKALRSAEAEAENLARLDQRIALGDAAKPRDQRRRATRLERDSAVAPSFDPVPTPVMRTTSPPSSKHRRNRQLTRAEINSAVERALAGSQATRRGDED